MSNYFTCHTIPDFCSHSKMAQRHTVPILRFQLSRSVLTSSRVWYGYSYLLSWVVCIIFMVSGVAFFANSKKRKMLPFDYETNFK